MANHDHASLVRYLSGELHSSEKAAVESHLETCGECNEFVSFTRDFSTALKQAAPGLLQPETPCPDAAALVAFEAGELNEEMAQIVRQHTVLCRDCLEELDGLRQAREAAEIPRELPSLLHKFKDKVIDLTKTYGPGAMIGLIRITAEQPAFEVRGEAFKTFFKSLEIPVRGNSYNVQLTLSGRGLLYSDIAGFYTPMKVPLSVHVLEETGAEILSTKSDEFGKCHFTIPLGFRTGELIAVVLTLEGVEEGFLFRVPEQHN